MAETLRTVRERIVPDKRARHRTRMSGLATWAIVRQGRDGIRSDGMDQANKRDTMAVDLPGPAAATCGLRTTRFGNAAARLAACLGALAVLWLMLITPAYSQSATPIDAIATQVAQYDAALRAIARDARDARLDDAALRDRAASIRPIDQALDAIVADLSARTAAIDARLGELGPPPAAGQPPESPEISQERANLVAIRQSVDSQAKQAKVLTVVTDQLTTALADRRRALFSERLWTSSRSILDPRLWIDFGQNVPLDAARLGNLYKAQGRQFVTAAHGNAVLAGWLISVIMAGLLLFPGGYLLLRLGDRYAAGIETASRLRRSVRALWIVCVIMALPLTAGWVIRVTLGAGGALTPQMDSGLALLIRATGFSALLYGLARALLSVGKPSWRMTPIFDDHAEKLRHYPAVTAIAVGLANAVAGLNSTFGMSLSTSIVTDAMTVLIELAIIGRVLTVIAMGRDAGAVDQADTATRRSQMPWAIAALASWMGLIGAIGAAVLGYLALATFLAREMVWSATVLGCLYLLIQFADDLFPALLGQNSRAGRFAGSVLGLSRSTLDQTGILLAGFARLSLLLFGWSAIVAPLGASTSDVLGRISASDLVLRLGPVAISPGTIVGGVVLFAVGLLITRAIRSWVEGHYLPSTTLDIGVRTSLSAGVSYLGVFVALLIASAYLGVSLDRIALLAGALSVGIGFGLQAVIGNFVSGLILLAERPVKVGDWIAIGDLEGDVKRINVRATEIEMSDRSRLIVPNSELVTKTIRNVTHGAALGRIRIVLKVNDDADVIALRSLLLAHLSSHATVLDDPEPKVFLTDAKDGGLEFTCFAYVPSARQAYAVRSDLLFEIIPDLRGKGFALSNSTPIVNVGVMDRAIEPSATG
jgi:small-conductance mechanosensitive channel